jgi:hypothetical protein
VEIKSLKREVVRTVKLTVEVESSLSSEEMMELVSEEEEEEEEEEEGSNGQRQVAYESEKVINSQSVELFVLSIDCCGS